MDKALLESTAVAGAAGKMGSGIALLLLKAGAKTICYDPRSEALEGLRAYLLKQLEKHEIAHLLENATFTSDKSDLAGTELLFEAIVEEVDAKVALYKEIKKSADPIIFTNTSSIPISELNKKARLKGRIVGFHFYNPPAVQKLLELIVTDKTSDEVKTLAFALADLLEKSVVPSSDIAGFIGNGHFVRDALYACREAQQFDSLVEGICTLNRVSEEFLIRPMGIFQLLDYVGLDVAQKIMRVMDSHISGETFQSDLIDRMVSLGVVGGQNPDGSQKDGFFHYEKNKPTFVYDLEHEHYTEKVSELGPLPPSHQPWKALLKIPNKESELETYFRDLQESDSEGARRARNYLQESERIARKLVADGVAASTDDVNKVLTLGFFHLYGPVNHFLAAATQ